MPVLEHKSFEGGISSFSDRGIRGAFKFASNIDIRKTVDTLSCGQALIDEGILGTSHSQSASVSQSQSLSPSSSNSASFSPSGSNSPSLSPSPSASRSASKSLSPSSSASPSSSVSPSLSPSAGLNNVYVDLVIAWVKATDGNTYGFGNAGNIYRRYSDGFTRNVYRDTNGSIKGAIEKPSDSGQTYLQWATNTSVKQKPLPGASDWSDVTEIADNLTGADWHTMKQVGGANYIANGSKLALVGYDGSWTNEALDLIPGNIAKTLLERNGRTVIGTHKSGYPNKGVNAMIDCEVPLVQIGDDGELFFSNFTDSIPVKRFPGGGRVNPYGVANEVDQIEIFDWVFGADSWVDKQTLGNMSLWGVFDADSGKNGVYTYGRRNKEQPFTMNLEYALEVDEIGAVANVEGVTIVSYRDGSDFGVKAVDATTKATGTWEGLEFRAPIKKPEQITTFNYVEIFMDELPVGCSVYFYYQKNKSGDWIQAYTADGNAAFTTTGGKKAVFRIGAEMDIYEPRIIMIPSGNTTPEIYRIRTYFN
jgi:hypothetical protein